jgi:hypothetical protein
MGDEHEVRVDALGLLGRKLDLERVLDWILVIFHGGLLFPPRMGRQADTHRARAGTMTVVSPSA